MADMPSGLEGGVNGIKFSLWQPNRSVKVRSLPLQLAQFRLMSYSELPVPFTGRVFLFKLLSDHGTGNSLPGKAFGLHSGIFDPNLALMALINTFAI